MRYYCNICKKDITKAEFLYSIDKFDRPLCREHQKLEREKQEPTINQTTNHTYRSPQTESKEEKADGPEEIIEESQSKWKTLVKKAVVVTGKGIAKGVKKIADSTKKTMQIRRWKEDVLRRMYMNQLKRLCFEKRVSTKKSELKESRSGGFYWKEYNCTKGDLVDRLKNKVSLDDIISFAKRNHINIRDILRDIDKKKAEWRVKELSDIIEETGESIIPNLEKIILEFQPSRRYDNELPYQIELAGFLKSYYQDTKIEERRGNTRPDIVVEGVAIEVKGPTRDHDLVTLTDKCGRYRQYFPPNLIIVLFDIRVNQYRLNETVKSIKNIFPEVVIIKK